MLKSLILLLPSVLCCLASPLAAEAVAAPDARELAIALLSEQADMEPLAAGFLRRLAVGLGAGTVSLEEAERLLAMAHHLGRIGPRPVPPSAASAPRDAAPREPLAELDLLLDGPAAAVTPSPAAAAPPAASPRPGGAEGAWQDRPDRRGVVRSMAQVKGVDRLLITPDEGSGFVLDDRFVVRVDGRDLVHGIITMAREGMVIGNLIDSTWADGERRQLVGDEPVIGIERAQ